MMESPSSSSASSDSHLQALPTRVAHLAAANTTLIGSLQSAHGDMAALLLQRDELVDSLRSTEDALDDVCLSTSQWYAADIELTRRRAEQVRDSIEATRALRHRMEVALSLLSTSGS